MGARDDADQLLFRSYDSANGRLMAILALRAVADELGWEFERAVRAGEYLSARGYLKWAGIGGQYALTVQGINAVEELSPQPAKQADRLAFLMHSYQRADGDPQAILNMWEQANELGWEREATAQVYEYLSAQGFLRARALGGHYTITEQAVDLIERASTDPASPTEYFPPLSSLSIRDSTIVASNVASPGGTVSVHNVTVQETNQSDERAAALDSLYGAISAAPVDDRTRRSALSDVQSLRSQSQNPNANGNILKLIWESICTSVPDIVESVARAGNAVATIRQWVER